MTTARNTYDAFVFDLDGTLLHTLPDLLTTTNICLEQFGFPTITLEDIRLLVGDGQRRLVETASPKGTSPETLDAMFELWKATYVDHLGEATRPYAGIPEVLDELHARGKKTAVLSNKYDGGAKAVIEQFLPGKFDLVLGSGPVPRKPDPTGIRHVAEQLGVPLKRLAYFGDSNFDMRTAANAQILGVGVTWGYEDEQTLWDTGASAVIHQVEDILSFA